MASKRGGTNRSRRGSSLLASGLSASLRWIVVPCLGFALFVGFGATFASLHSAKSAATTESFVSFKLPAAADGDKQAHRPTWKEAAMAVSKARAASAAPAPAKTDQAQPQAKKPVVVAKADPFANIVASAGPSRDKLLAALSKAGVAVADDEAVAEKVAALELPSSERFHRVDDTKTPEAVVESHAAILDPSAPLVLPPIGLPVELAYAEVDTDATDEMELALASLALVEPEPEPTVAVAMVVPEKPEIAVREKPEAGKPEAARPEQRRTERGERTKPAMRSPRSGPDSGKPDPVERTEALAYARPDNPSNAFKKLFNDTPKGAHKVAIYDISAAVVHMPDGTKLEAHSGIGKMADNPRYVHVKMNGPTPPNTYKLTMREKPFYGVDAIRMTPIGKETMHGRDGILAHSYLLRGGRAESHGCVAFKNYDRFLKAFRQGKVTHIVVVPSMASGGAKVRLASMGRI